MIPHQLLHGASDLTGSLDTDWPGAVPGNEEGCYNAAFQEPGMQEQYHQLVQLAQAFSHTGEWENPPTTCEFLAYAAVIGAYGKTRAKDGLLLLTEGEHKGLQPPLQEVPPFCPTPTCILSGAVPAG